MKERLFEIENCEEKVKEDRQYKINDRQKAYRECLEIVIEKLNTAQMELSISVETRDFKRMKSALDIQNELNDTARKIAKMYEEMDGYL